MQFPRNVAVLCAMTYPLIVANVFASGPKAVESPVRESTMMPLVAPLLIQNQKLTNTLTLVSNSDDAMAVKTVIRDRSGHEIVEITTPLEAHSERQVDITKLISGKWGNAAFVGNLLVSSADPNFASLAAQLSIASEEPVNPVRVEEELLMLGTKPNNSFRATMATAAAPAAIALTSLVDTPQMVSVTCIAEHAQPSTASITLAGGQMILLSACYDRAAGAGPPEPMSPHEKFSSAHAIGVSVSSSAMPGGLAVYGVGYTYTSDRMIRTVALPFQQSAFTYSSSAVYVGVPIGQADHFESSLFYPEAAVTNFGARSTEVTVDYSTINANQPDSIRILSVNIPARTTISLSLPSLPGDSRLRNSFVIKADADAGQFYSSLRSTSEEFDARIVELTGKDRSQVENGGEHPWRVDQDTNSILLLFNPDPSSEREVNLTVDAASAQREERYSIKPLETKSIEVGQLIGSAGTINSNPINQSGIVTWVNPLPGGVFGRVLEINSERKLARNFSCGTKTVLCKLTVNANPLQIATGGTASTSTTGYGCTVAATSTSCTGTSNQNTVTGKLWFWSSQDTSIASIQGSNAASDVTLKGNKAGSTSITGSMTDSYGCPATGTATVNVGVGCPTSITIAARTTLPLEAGLNNNFPTYLTGVGLLTTMQVGPEPPSGNGIKITEGVAQTSNNCPVGYLCGGGSTFTVGPPGSTGTTFGTPFPALQDYQFFDEHVYAASSNVLSSGPTSCAAVCAQVYYCNAQIIGRFTVTKTLTKSTISGTPVTVVTVTKQ